MPTAVDLLTRVRLWRRHAPHLGLPCLPWDHGRGMGLGTCTAARQWQEMTIQQKNTPWSVLLRSPHEHRPSLADPVVPLRPAAPLAPSPHRHSTSRSSLAAQCTSRPPGLPASPPLALSPAAPPSERTALPAPHPPRTAAQVSTDAHAATVATAAHASTRAPRAPNDLRPRCRLDHGSGAARRPGAHQPPPLTPASRPRPLLHAIASPAASRGDEENGSRRST